MEALILCLAMNIYFESRAEPLPGQYAVAEVTLRRAKRAGTSVCETVFQDAQFSWTRHSDGFKVDNAVAWDTATRVAREVVRKPTDFSKGATHFHATYVAPSWSNKLCVTTRIGRHIFYKECDGKPA